VAGCCYTTTWSYPILYFIGEQGSAKSTTQKVLRRLIDPYKAVIVPCIRQLVQELGQWHFVRTVEGTEPPR